LMFFLVLNGRRPPATAPPAVVSAKAAVASVTAASMVLR
jgi:hypothetical protein